MTDCSCPPVAPGPPTASTLPGASGETALSKTLMGFGATLTDNLKKARTQLEASFKSKEEVLLPLTRFVCNWPPAPARLPNPLSDCSGEGAMPHSGGHYASLRGALKYARPGVGSLAVPAGT